MQQVDTLSLDPNIRRTVAFLRAHLFNTTDSGDGSKAEAMDCAVDYPMVAMTAPRDTLLDEAQRLADLLAAVGVDVAAHGIDIQATWSPIDRTGLIVLANLHDGILP